MNGGLNKNFMKNKEKTNIKDYIAQRFIGETLRFVCECLVPFDITGKIVDYEVKDSEIIFLVEYRGKIIKISENHPKLYIEVVE